jgi:predicted Zn-dependent protease
MPTGPVSKIYATVASLVLIACGSGCSPRKHSAVGRPIESREAALRRAVEAAPKDPRPRLAWIAYLLDRHHLQDALAAAREASLRFPDTSSVKEALSEALFETARRDEAISVLRSVGSAYIGGQYRLASYLIRTGRREEGVRLAQRLPSSSESERFRQAEILLDGLRPDLAVAVLRRGSVRTSDSATALALALLSTGAYGEAARQLERLAANTAEPSVLFYFGAALRLSGQRSGLPDAEQSLLRATQLSPQDGLIAYELARTQLAQRHAADGLATLKRAAELAPEIPEIQRDLAGAYAQSHQPMDAALARGRYYRLLDDPFSVIKELSPFYHPGGAPAVGLLLASGRMEAREYAAAAAILTSLRQAHPNDPEVLWEVYHFHATLQRWPEANDALAALAKATPRDPEVLRERAELLERTSRFAELGPTLLDLRDASPSDAATHFSLGRYYAFWSTEPDRTRLAEQSLREAIRLNPDLVGASTQLGKLLLASDRLAEARSVFVDALDRAPEQLEALRGLGQVDTRLADAESARQAFQLGQQLQGDQERETTLHAPVDQRIGLPRSRRAFAAFFVRRGRLGKGMEQLEALEHQAPEDQETHRLLGALYGHARRFQRQSEELRSGGGSGR